MKNKKLLTAACAAAVCITGVIAPGYVMAAPGELAISLVPSAVEVEQGDEFTLDINWTNADGLGFARAFVDFDPDKMTFDAKGSELKVWGDPDGNDNEITLNPKTGDNGVLKLIWSADGASASAGDGVYGTLKFKLNEDVDPNELIFTLYTDGKKGSFIEVPSNKPLSYVPATNGCTVTVVEAANTDQEDVDAAKAKVEAAVAAMTVSNNTTQADVDAVVQKALEGTGVKGVTTAVITKSDDKTEGKVDVTVALSKGKATGTAEAAVAIPKTTAVVTYKEVAEVKATCTAEGKKAHYVADPDDGKKYTKNADGTYTAVADADLVIAKIPHNYVDGVCTMCGEKEPSTVTYTKVPAKAATCTATGNVEYYTGSDNKLYTLADGKYTETTLAAVTTAKIAHTYVDGKCTVCGAEDPNYKPDVPVVDYDKLLTDAEAVVKAGWWNGATGQDWIRQDNLAASYDSVKAWITGLPEGVEISDIKAVVKDSAAGEAEYTVTLKAGDKTKDVSFKLYIEKKAAPVSVYYAVTFTGDYVGSGVTVTGSRAAGAAMTLNVPVGYSATVVSGNNRITTVTDGTGTFTMPAANVTVKVESYLGMLSTGYKNAYIYSYDKDMNYIKTNSVRGGMTSPEGEVTVKLGSDYAGRSVTLYSGRKNTSSKVDEATLNSNGEAAFSVKSGKNYTLVVD